MIVYIEETLYLDAAVDLSSTEDDMADTLDEFNEIKALLDSYTVHHMIDCREDTTVFSIYTQKITLDEFAMNNLFHNILNVYFDIEISYASIGGKGCDMALTVRNKAND